MIKFFIIFLFILITACHTAAQEVIIMGSDEWYPYVGTPDHRGYILEIADIVFARKGIKIDYRQTPWARVIRFVRKGKMGAAVAMLKKDAPDFILHDEPLGVFTSSFFVLKNDNWTYTDISSLKKKRLGIIKDYLYEAQIYKYIQDNKNSELVDTVYGNNPLRKNIKKLISDRIDVLVENPVVFYHTVKLMSLRRSDFKEVPLNTNRRMLYIGFSPAIEKSTEYAKVLSDGIIELRKNGELHNILERYGVSDWK